MRFTKILAVNTIYKLLNVVAAFVVTTFLTRLMTVSGFGLLSLMIANAAIFNLITSLGADSAIVYHTSSQSLSFKRVVFFSWIIILFQLLILLIAESIFHYFYNRYMLVKTEDIRNAWPGIIFLLSVSVIEKYSAFFFGKHLFSLCNRLLFLVNVFMLLIFAIYYFGKIEESVYFYIWLFTLFYALQALILVISWHSMMGVSLSFNRLSKNEIRIFLSYSFIALTTNIIQFFAYRVDYWILDYYQGEKEVGWYSLAVKLLQVYWVVPNALAAILLARIANKNKFFDEAKLLVLIRTMNTVNIISAFILAFTVPVIIPAFFGEAFRNSIDVFRILLPGYVFFCITIILASFFAANKRLKINLISSVICFSVIIILDFLLIPAWGMKGAAIASSIGYTGSAIYLITIYALSRKRNFLSLLIPYKSDFKTLFTFVKSELIEK